MRMDGFTFLLSHIESVGLRLEGGNKEDETFGIERNAISYKFSSLSHARYDTTT